MSQTIAGPFVSYGNQPGSGINTDAGPGAILGGNGWVDPRVGVDNTRKGWIGVGVEYRRVLAQVPATKGSANIAALANVTSGTPMTLAGASTGITVLGTGGLYVNGSGNTVPAGALVLDGNPTITSYGYANAAGNYNNNAYTLGTLLARAVSITGVVSGTGGAFTIRGYDIYGYPMSETITAGAGVNTVNGKKAFKFIASITPGFTDAHTYSVGTTDIFGFPVKAAFWHEVLVYWNSTLITASTGFVAADATSPATATTGDVRGTYAVQDASDGTKRLSLVVGPSQSGLATAAGLFGVTQFTS